MRIGAKQYRVEKGDTLLVDRMQEDEGAKVTLEPLLLRGDGKDDAVFAADDLAKVKVEATVTGHERGKKVHVLKFKPKKGYKRRQGHRSELTRLEIGEIKLLSRRPAAKRSADEPAAAKGASKASKSKPAADKPAAKEEDSDGS